MATQPPTIDNYGSFISGIKAAIERAKDEKLGDFKPSTELAEEQLRKWEEGSLVDFHFCSIWL